MLVGSLGISLLREVAEHPLERVEAAVELVEARLEPRLQGRVVGLVDELALLFGPRHEGRRDHRGDDREERDPLQHHEGGDDAAAPVRRRDVAVPDGRHRLERPPHPDPDARVLARVERPDQDAAADYDQARGSHDHAGGCAHRRRLAHELGHAPLDRVDTRHVDERGGRPGTTHHPNRTSRARVWRFCAAVKRTACRYSAAPAPTAAATTGHSGQHAGRAAPHRSRGDDGAVQRAGALRSGGGRASGRRNHEKTKERPEALLCSPSRSRFRPPLSLTLGFRLTPSRSASTYLRSVLGARGNLWPGTCPRKRPANEKVRKFDTVLSARQSSSRLSARLWYI